MIWFPQLNGGALAQFPLVRSRSWRAISNELEDGSRIMLPDGAGDEIEWRLPYRDLNDMERQKLVDLFAQCRGRFGAFAFVDPTANLLGWSEDLARADWQAGLLQTSGGVSDPVGSHAAWSITNPTAGAQALQQSVSVTGDYACCFSAYVRSAAAGTVILARDSAQVTARSGPAWRRVFISGRGMAGAEHSTFSLTLSAGQALEVWGLQVEAQPYPGGYKKTAAARGIYEQTFFATDELAMRSDGVGRSSCGIVLTSRA